MMPPTRRRPAGQKAGFRLAVIGLFGGAIAVGSWTGCTVTKQNYKTLSFFFDGVPDPSAPAGQGAGRSGPDGKPAFAVVHRPYAEEKCDACHKTRYRPSRNDSSICLQCHAAVQTEHPLMHGPVVATACLWCHTPHESTRPALLRDDDRKVCSQCHTGSTFDASTVPAHGDPARACLECHFGHGGNARFMLRPGAAADSPPPTPTGATPEKK